MKSDLENYEYEDKTNNVYMFHNIKHDLHLFINADGYERCNDEV